MAGAGMGLAAGMNMGQQMAGMMGGYPQQPYGQPQQGYGTANVASAFRAVDVITGAAPMPVRSDVDAWIALVDSVRETVYPSPTYP